MKTFAMFAVLSLAVAGAVGAADRSGSDAYLPGFGEFMSATQMRHAKLWFAGDAQNWDLAAFELDEIKEGLEDATRLHPTHEGIPVAAMIKANLDGPLTGLAKAVEAKDKRRIHARLRCADRGLQCLPCGGSARVHQDQAADRATRKQSRLRAREQIGIHLAGSSRALVH